MKMTFNGVANSLLYHLIYNNITLNNTSVSPTVQNFLFIVHTHCSAYSSVTEFFLLSLILWL